MADHAAWKTEEARQAQIYAEAIDAAVKEASKQFETPIMNALCGALVTMQAAVLSAVEDPRARKALRKAMENELPRAPDRRCRRARPMTTHPGAQYLAELRESAKKATQGEWRTFNGTDIFPDDDDVEATRHIADCSMSGWMEAEEQHCNAAHIANASPARIAAIAEYVASEKARADAAEAERNVFKAKDASKSKLLERFRDLLLNMCDHFEDEGDRVFFGSTNDPDELREIAREMDAWKWDAIMGQTKSDPYAKLREQSATIASLTVKLEEAETERDRLRNKVPARVLTDAQLVDEDYAVGAVIDEGFGEGGGSPGEWWYERADEIDHEQKRRVLERQLAYHSARATLPRPTDGGPG